MSKWKQIFLDMAGGIIMMLIALVWLVLIWAMTN